MVDWFWGQLSRATRETACQLDVWLSGCLDRLTAVSLAHWPACWFRDNSGDRIAANASNQSANHQMERVEILNILIIFKYLKTYFKYSLRFQRFLITHIQLLSKIIEFCEQVPSTGQLASQAASQASCLRQLVRLCIS